MRIRSVLAVLVIGAGIGLLPAPASASEKASASGSLGHVNLRVHGRAVTAAPIAPCDANGPLTNQSAGTELATAKFQPGNTECARPDGAATAKIAARGFETDVLREFGGPVIRVREYSTECHTKGDGSSAGVTLFGVGGVAVPAQIQPNNRVVVPGRNQGDPPLAEVVLNELITPTPADGSLVAHAMRITLFPEGGGDASGDIVVGEVACDPF